MRVQPAAPHARIIAFACKGAKPAVLEKIHDHEMEALLTGVLLQADVQLLRRLDGGVSQRSFYDRVRLGPRKPLNIGIVVRDL